MFRSSFLWTAMAAVAAALAAPATSQATFTATLSVDGGSGFTITDGTTGVNPDGALDGTISLAPPPPNSAALGPFVASGSVTTSNSASGAIPATLRINSFSLQNTDSIAHALTLTIEDDKFTNPQELKILWSNLSATSLNGTFALTNYVDGVAGTTLTATGNGAGVIAYGQPTNGIFEEPFAPNVGTNYSIKMVVTVTLAGGGSLELAGAQARVYPTPAPAGLVMLAGALPFAGLLRLRRRLPKPEATAA